MYRVGGQRHLGANDPIAEKDDAACVCPIAAGLARRGKLPGQLVRRPQVIVIEERQPFAPCLGDTTISRRADARRLVQPNYPYSAVGQRMCDSRSVVIGRIVDDQDLEIDSSLAQRAAQRSAN